MSTFLPIFGSPRVDGRDCAIAGDVVSGTVQKRRPAVFRASVVVLKDGRLVTGLVLPQQGELLILVDEQGQEQRIPARDVEQRRQQKLSPMPANVAEKTSETEFYDLLAFLLSRRQARNTGN